MLYWSWDMMCGRSNCHFSFWAIFCPFTPDPENFKKMKKILGDIILHQCTNNNDLMPYCSWDIVHDISNCYFSFWATFCPFTPPPPPTAQEMKIPKKKNPTCRYFHFTQAYQKSWSYTILFLRYGTWQM